VYVGVDADRPTLLLGLLVLAIVPWLYEAFRGCDAPYVLYGVLVAAMVALHPVGQAVGVTDADGDSQASFLILLVACAQLAATRAMASWILLALAALATIIVAAYVGPAYGSAGVWAGALVFTLLGGLLVRKLLSSNAELHHAHAALAARAAADERRRIAREVHDVIAHSMTVTMLHVTAARMAVQRGDVDGAAEALEEAERAGRTSLADIRTTVGLLRDDGGGVEPVAPTGADVHDLIARYRNAGLDIEAAVDIRLASVPPATGLAVYRIVQEALANVAKHVPGAPATVLVEVAGTSVQVHVVNDGPEVPDSGGHGLRGMRERVEALGGRFEAGPTPTGWRVWAALP
jgi:signal transduction histidine kinase